MIFIRNQRTMDIYRYFPAKCLIQTIVLRGRGKILVSTDNMGNSHQMIVYHICKIVSRISIGLDQNHIVQLRIVNGNIPVNLILERCRSLRRVILADDIRYACGKFFFYFFLGKMQTVLVIYMNFFSCNYFFESL